MTDLWGGRFREAMDERFRRFSSSLPVDRRLVRHDLAGTAAHAAALRDAGVLDAATFERVDGAITAILGEVDAGAFPPAAEGGDGAEDIHSLVEARLVEEIGEDGRRVHAGRSRNDQVVTDTLLWLKEASTTTESAVRTLQRALVERAEAHPDLITFAYTHLQRAQPVLLAHHLLAHVEALDRDAGRLADARARADRCPLGAGACAGTSLPIDREMTARRLGFARVATHSIDAVSDRDWAIEYVGACALIMTHLSRLAEELVLWSTPEFGLVRLGDAWCTGSSMLPQKRNPDVAELVRGKAARVHAALAALHSLLKGLPLAYNRDLQEDKTFLFDACDTTCDCAVLLAGAVSSAHFLAPAPRGNDFSSATDLAEELVQRGIPFREAHERIGRLVRTCEESGRGFADATESELIACGLQGVDRALFTPEGSIRAKRSLGSTAPQEVARSLIEWRKRVGS